VQDLSVLTPPLLMCAAVLFAVGAFLRHEMSKKRPDEDDGTPNAPSASNPRSESADSDVTNTDVTNTDVPAGTPRER
jgi:hypothetical protein